MQTLSSLFLALLALHLVVQAWLARRQIRHVLANRGSVPAAFVESVAPAEHAKAADYTAARERLGLIESTYDAGILLALTLGGGISAIDDWVHSAGPSPLAGGVATVLLVLASVSIANLPFGLYRTFRLERRFGFNRTSAGTFALDLLKGWLLGALLFGALLAVVLWIMRSTGEAWWLVAWGAWLGFSLLVTWAWPRLIAPLFNEFTPLQDAALRERIDTLLQRCGFRSSGIYVMDGSRRSSHGNAYFTGLGRAKRIVFFDTLLATLSPAQVEAVLAHELGHFRLRHVPKRLVGGAALSLAGFALLGWLSGQAAFYAALGVDRPGDAVALVLFALVAPVVSWPLGPLLAAWSRRHEFEADEFAARHASGAELAHALVRMYRDNASTLTPDPVHSAFHDSHPPPAQRVARLEAVGLASANGVAVASA